MRNVRCRRTFDRWSVMSWGVFLLSFLLLGGNAHAQASATVSAPSTIVGGATITIPVSFSTLSTTSGNSTFKITLDSSLMEIAALCDATASSSGACSQVSGISVNANEISGTISNLAQSQAVVISVSARVPTEKTATDYANPGSIATNATLTLPGGGVPSSSQGNTTVTYQPYQIDVKSKILSPAATFSFDTDEIVIENTYVNNGPGSADGAIIHGELYTRDSVNMADSPWTLAGLQINCVASNGARCPAAPIQLGGDGWYGQTAVYKDRVPVLPAGGSVVVTMRFKITKPAATATCGISYQGVIQGVAGLGWSSARYNPSMNPQSNERLSTVTMQLPPCPATDLSAAVAQAPATLALDTPYDIEYVFKNNGPLSVPAYLSPDLVNQISDSSIQVNMTPWQCTSGGANCPDANGNVGNLPAGTEIRLTRTVTLTQVGALKCGADSDLGRLLFNSRIDISGKDPITGQVFVDSDRNNNSDMKLSNLNMARPPCPTRDLGAAIESLPATLQFGKPYVVRFSYTNYGADDLVWDGSSDQGPLSFMFSAVESGSFSTQFAAGTTMTCVASPNAVCPAISTPASLQNPFTSGSGWGQWSSSFGMNRSFTIPANGSLTFELTLHPTGYTEQCPNGLVGRPTVSAGIQNPAPYQEPRNDPHSNDATASTTKAPVCEDVTVNKQLLVNGAQANSAQVNAPISFNLSASTPTVDQGGSDVTNSIIEDVLPVGFVFDPATPGQFACSVVPAGDSVTTCATFGSGITWDATTRLLKIVTPIVKAGSTATYEVLGKTADQAGVWSNTATLALNDVDFFDPKKVSNTSKVNFTIVGRDPTVIKSTKDATISTAGANVRYNIVVTNPSNGNAVTMGRLTDTLPSGFVLVSSSTPVVTGGGSYDGTVVSQPGDSALNWGSFTLAAGGSISVDFVVRSNPALKCGPDVINNSATFRYSTAAEGAMSVVYDGAAQGHADDDVTFPCAPSTTGNLGGAMAFAGEPLPSGFVPEAGMFALCKAPSSTTETRYPATGFALMTKVLSAQIADLPADAVCVVQLDPAKPITAAPAGYRWSTSSPAIAPATLTIVGGKTVTSTFTWTLERNVADLTVGFATPGSPSGYAGVVGVYATCDLPTAGTRYPASGVISINAQANGIISNVPVGASCSIHLDGAPLPSVATGYQWTSAQPVVAQPAIMIVTGSSASINWPMAVSPNDNGSTGTPQPVPVNQWQALAVLSVMLAWAGWLQRKRLSASAR